MTEATKARLEIQRNVLRVILGEIDIHEVRSSKPITDDECCRIIKKTLQGVEEMLHYKPNDPKFELEKTTLQALLPKELSDTDIQSALSAKLVEIKAAKSDGQATGVAMKYFKELNLTVDGNVVKKVVCEIRK